MKFDTMIDFLLEANYSGALGLMEIIKFKQIATPEQERLFDRLVKEKKNKEARELVQQVTDMTLTDKRFNQ